ncbi:hypothetical protein BKA82DRAFT_991352 [Pisolithus tinctorius]|uniref:BIR-domain-containing protein n=1 Tax=Pisolithus tinctorius Marx 270 TaxID=870435 RepID=A0A0C3PK74_PISTI|nr:hypothetical protein BKA82DRAFT_991352 [Pisolithus tinctorius]KIO14610.1 hypothetical protein M404DRAFT_991352 [Pisolithus tinctorius Marx 270]
MPPTPAMHALQNRVESFKKSKRVKRYPSKKTSTQSATVKWPHPPSYKANANTLAEAGFFFCPSWDDRDCVACFLCGKELSDWDAQDDPFAVHYEKCGEACGWAIVRCGLVEDMDSEGSFTFTNKARIPTTKAIEEARLKTFGEDWWPYDDDPNHGASSRKMARAGFVYTPQGAGDDTVTCLYCNTALGGWDKDDDPIHEHRKRATKLERGCPFFSFAQPTPPAKLARSGSIKAGKKSTAALPKHTRTHSRTRSRKEDKATKVEKGDEETEQEVTTEKGQRVNPQVDEEPKPSPPVPPDAAIAMEAEDDDPRPPLPSPEPEPESAPAPTSAPTVSATSPALPAARVPIPDAKIPVPMIVEDSVFYTASTPVLPPSEALTEEERELSVEQWIRREISLSYEKLMADGQNQIMLFKERAAEVRTLIEDL